MFDASFKIRHAEALLYNKHTAKGLFIVSNLCMKNSGIRFLHDFGAA